MPLPPDPTRPVIRLQGWWYLLTGLWAFLHRRSFQWVVGHKPDLFQLDATSALFTGVGVTLLAAVRQPRVSDTARLLAVSSALASVAAEWRHRRVLRPVYLLDALTELGLAGLVISGWRRSR